MYIYSFLRHAMHWLCMSGVVLTVLTAGLQFLNGRRRAPLPLLFATATVFVVTDVIVRDPGSIGTLVDVSEKANQLASMFLPLLGYAFGAAFCCVAFLLMLKKLLE